MKTSSRLLVMLALVALAVPVELAAQDLHSSRRPSPMGMARTMLDGDTYVRVIYSRPYLRGRDNIFGSQDSEALVPYGQLWRTGANEATEITVTGDVMVGGEKLPAGTYSLFTTPGPERWTIHFSSALGLSGTGFFDAATSTFTPVDLEATGVTAVTVPAGKAEETVDQFTISFADADGGSEMVLAWADTEVRVPIKPAG